MKNIGWWLLGAGAIGVGFLIYRSKTAAAVVNSNLPMGAEAPGTPLTAGQTFTGVPWSALSAAMTAQGLNPTDLTYSFGVNDAPTDLVALVFSGTGYTYLHASSTGVAIGGGSATNVDPTALSKLQAAWTSIAQQMTTVTG